MKIVYIDAQNAHKGIQELGRLLDREVFFEYLKQKFNPDACKIFFGYIPKLQHFYDELTRIGYSVVFKQIGHTPDGRIKGNVDVDIVMHIMDDLHTGGLTKAYLVSGDGDFNTLVYRLKDEKKLGRLLVPNLSKTTHQLRKSAGDGFVYSLSQLQNKFKLIQEELKKTHHKDRSFLEETS